MPAPEDARRKCGTPECGQDVPSYFSFCDGCQNYLPESFIGRWLSSHYAAFAIMVLVFGIEGFTTFATWPIFLFLFCLYMHAIVIGAGYYRPQRGILCLLSLASLAIVLYRHSFEHTLFWFELTATCSVVVIFLIKDIGSLRVSSLSLLAAAWLYGDSRARGIMPENNLATAVHTTWVNIVDAQPLSRAIPSIVTLVSTRFYWLFLGTAVVVGIYTRRGEISSIRVPEILPTPRWRVRLREVVLRPNTMASTGLIDALIRVASWILSYVAYAFVLFVCYLWFIVGNAGGIVAYCVLWALNQLLRLLFYIFTVLFHVIVGFVRACWLSCLVVLLGAAVSCLVLVVPLLIAAATVHECSLTAFAVSQIIHHKSVVPQVIAVHALGCVLLFTVGLCIALWCIDPNGAGMFWWRDSMKQGLGQSSLAWRQFKLIGSTDTNYLRGIAVRLLPAHFFALLGYDILGKVVGGPYQFGYLLWFYLIMLLATVIVNLALRRDPWRIVGK